ncbi:hypothetical protein RP20_CCG018464 [Aedes albopictus]|nr:hypothetical protein RP20_CCG018464 [Aedes albopictus]
MPSRTIPQIKLQSEDEQILEVSPKIYKCLNTINSMLDDPFRTAKIEEAIPVPNVSTSSLEKVLEWAEYHIDDEPLEENDGCIPVISEWERQFLQVEKNVLIELVLASEYLGIQRLLDITNTAVVDFIKNEPPRNVEDSTTMDDDFVVEQQENEFWCIALNFESDSGAESDYED